MAATIGKDGDVKIGTATVAYMDTWSLTPNINTPELTSFGDAARVYGSALRDAGLTFSGTLDRSDTDQADLMDQFEDGTLADIAVRLYTAAASYWSGNVRLTGQTVNSQIEGKVAITWNGIVSGNLAFTSS